jgi:SAM-dependent methyltransferase
MFDRRKKIMEFLSADGDESLAVLEVGAGSGALAAIFAESKNSVTVVEPESTLDTDRLEKQSIRVIQDIWPTSQLLGEKFDLILCVQVLEHTERPREFLLELAKYVKDDGKIYLEVPSGDWVKRHGSAADVHFPHWNYFSESMIQRLAAECHLNILKRRELINGRDIGYVLQNAAIKTKYSFETPYQKFEIAELYDSIKFAERRINEWNTDSRYAFYGSTAQSQSVYGLFKTCKPKFVFDDTPSYHNAFAYSPEFRFPILNLSLSHLREVDVVVISSYVHDEAISKKLRDVGFIGDIYSLRPPSDPSGKVKSLFSEN